MKQIQTTGKPSTIWYCKYKCSYCTEEIAVCVSSKMIIVCCYSYCTKTGTEEIAVETIDALWLQWQNDGCTGVLQR